MKSIATVLQLTRGLLILTPAEYDKSEGGLQIRTKRGSSQMPTTFSLPQIFELNDSLKEHPYEKSEELAAFVKRCAESVSMELGDIFLCIEDEDVLITKEYKHPQAKDKLLRTFAQVEAEAVLHQEADKYTILNFEYGQQYGKASKSDEVSASLFAMNTGILTDIRANFEQAGLRVAKVTPPIAGLLYTSKEDVNSATRAIAVISMDFAATRLVVLHNGAPVFQQSFQSVLEDVAELLMLEFGVSKLGAIDLIRQEGLGVCNKCNSASTRKQTMTMLDNAAGEILRNLRMVISTMRIDIDQIVLCDVLAKLPNIANYCRQVGLTAPMENIVNLFSGGALPPVAAQSATQRGYDATSFITLNGVLTMPMGEGNLLLGETNILSSMKEKSSNTIGNIIGGAVAVAAILYMGAIGAWWGMLELQKNGDTNELAQPKYKTAEKLIQDEAHYKTALENLEIDLATLPQTEYKTSTVITHLWDEVVGVVEGYSDIQVDNTEAVITMSIDVKDYNTMVDFKNTINEAKFFNVYEGWQGSNKALGEGTNAKTLFESGINLYVTEEAKIAAAEEMQNALAKKASTPKTEESPSSPSKTESSTPSEAPESSAASEASGQ